MSRRLDVLQALKALIAAALPDADVIGLDKDAAIPLRAAPGGRVIVRAGDPGEPEVDLSPLSYNYQHRIPLEVYPPPGSDTEEERIDALLVPIGAAVELDRSLGGLVDWLEPSSPTTEDIYFEGAAPNGRADLEIVATYATSNPLT